MQPAAAAAWLRNQFGVDAAGVTWTAQRDAGRLDVMGLAQAAPGSRNAGAG